MATISELSVGIGVDLSDFTRSMQNVGNQLRNIGRDVEPIDIDVNATRAEQDIEVVQGQINRLDNESANPDVNVDTSRARRSLSELGEQIKGVGESLSKLTLPILGFGTAAGFVAAEFEGDSARIKNSLGLTVEEAENLTKKAKGIYRDGFGESMEDVRTALIQTKQNIRDINDEDLQKIVTQAQVLAETFDSEVNEVTRAGNNIMEGFGLSAEEAFDLMAHGAQNGLNFSNEMFDNLAEYAPLFGKMGFSAEEYFQLLEKGSQAGVYNLDYINDIMKEFQIRVKDGSKATSDAMDLLSKDTNEVWKSFLKGEGTVKDVHNTIINELKNMKDQVKANEIGVGLYGTKWEDLESDAVYALGGINGKLEGVAGTMSEMVETQEQTFGQRFQGMLRDLKSALLPLGEVILDLGEEWIPKISSAVSTLSKWFSDLTPFMQKVVVVLGAIGAAIGPVIVAVGSIVSGLGSLAGAFGVTGGAAGLLSGAFAALTGPIGLAVAGIAALTAGGIALYNHLSQDAIPEVDRFGEGVSEATKKALGGFFELSDGASQKLTELSLTQQKVTEETKDALVETYTQMNEQILAKMDERHAAQMEKTQEFFLNSTALTSAEEEKILRAQEMRNQSEIAGQEYKEAKIKEILEKASSEKRQLTESEQKEINSLQKQMNENAVTYLSENEREAKLIMEKMKRSAGDLSAKQAAEVVKNSKKQKDGVVKEAEKQYDDTLKEIMRLRDETGDISEEQAEKMIREATKQRDETVKRAEDMHKKVVNEAKSQAGEHIDTVNWETGEILSKWESFKIKTSKKWEEIKKNASEKWEQMKKDTAEKWEQMKTTASDKVEQMKTAVSDKMEEVRGKIEEIWDKVTDFFKNIDLKEIGKDIIQGLINGIGSMADAVWSKAKEIANGVLGSVKDALKIKSPSREMYALGVFTIEGFVKGMESLKAVPSDLIAEIGKEMKDRTTLTFSKIEKETRRKNKNIERLTKEHAFKIKRIDENERMREEEKNRLKLEAEEEYQMIKQQIIDQYTESTNKMRLTAEFESYYAILGVLNQKRHANEITAIEEMKIWKLAADSFAENTESKRNALIQLKNTQTRALEEMKAKNEELIAQEKAITAEYNKAVDERASKIADFAGIFDEFKIKTEQSGQDLMNNLKSQVDGFKLWQESITALSKRAINEGLLAELKALGPKAAGELAALNALTDEQLEEYSKLYQEKQALAREQAETELIGMKTDAEKRIDELRAVHQAELDEINSVWQTETSKVVNTADTELSKLKDVGINAGQGLADGLASMAPVIMSQAQSIANGIRNTIQSALNYSSSVANSIPDIPNVHSPHISTKGSSSNNVQGVMGGVTQNITINSPTPLSPAETARKSLMASRQLAMEWGY